MDPAYKQNFQGSGFCRQLYLMMWKNGVLKRRTPCSTCCEVLAPVLICIILLLIKAAVPTDNVKESYHLTSVRNVPNSLVPYLTKTACGHFYMSMIYNSQTDHYPSQVGVAPRSKNDATTTALVNQFISSTKSQLLSTIASQPMLSYLSSFNCATINAGGGDRIVNISQWIQNDMFRVFGSADEMDSYTQESGYAKVGKVPISIGVIFDAPRVVSPGNSLRYSYTLRANSSMLPSFSDDTDFLISSFDPAMFGLYVDSGVMGVQFLVNGFIAQLNNVTLPNMDLVPFPDPEGRVDKFGGVASTLMGLFLILGWMWPFSRLVRGIVEEKESRIKEGLKMMGLKDSAYWTSWCLSYLIMFFVGAIVVSLMLSPLYSYVDIGLVFLVVLFFCISCVALGLLISSLFSRAKSAAIISSLALLVLFLPYFGVSDKNISYSSKQAASLCSPVAFALSLQKMMEYQSVFQGIPDSEISRVVRNYSLADGIGFMVLDICLYFLLAWYLDNVVPQEFGTALPWYFPFTRSYWCGPDNTNHGKAVDVEEKSQNPDVEPITAELAARPGIHIQKLRKEFPTANPDEPHVAVNNLSLSMFEGQIFVLLGHNGAGKTTTISMLSGIYTPTSGTANVYGKDLALDMSSIRQMTGVCPQMDVIFPTMTVYEHLKLYASLKGVPSDQVEKVVTDSIEEVQLQKERDQQAGTMSGGQKRRLCLAIALIADSKVVFLDEPTSGVDPWSRRFIWDLITKKKAGRVIILTTHFMDEADQLGDRIAIMHHGKLKCCGTPLFLKSRFGVGYNITFSVTPACAPDAIYQTIHGYVATADKLSQVGTELSFRLPLEASEHFPLMLRKLDQDKQALGFTNYGLSITTMEEVFLKVAHESAAKDGKKHKEEEKEHKQAAFDMESLKADASEQRFFRHIQALLIKRWHYSKRDRRALCCQFITPIIVLVLGLALLRIPLPPEFRKLELNTAPFNTPFYTPSNPDMTDRLNLLRNWYTITPERFPVNITSAPSQYVPDPTMMTRQRADELYSFSHSLLLRRTDYEQTRFAAFYSSGANPLALFNNISALHGPPIWAHLASTAYLLQGTNNQSQMSAILHPFSLTQAQRETIQNVNGVFTAIIIALSFVFVPAAYVMFVVKEREIKAKHLQLISGVSPVAYWLSNFIWDFISFSVVATIMALVVLAFGNENFVGSNYGLVWLSFYLFGLAVIPFTYLCSFLFTSNSTAQLVMILAYFIFGVVLLLVSFALYSFESTKKANEKLRFFFRCFPHFALADTIFFMSIRSFFGGGLWDLDVSGYNLIFMAWESVAYTILTLVVERLFAAQDLIASLVNSTTTNSIEMQAFQDDDDVQAEKDRIKAGNANEDLIRLEGLRKVYPNGKVAVHDLWYAIPRNECFGFLGVNGAGKSTTLKILTGDEVQTKGQAFIVGHNISTEPETVRRHIGYCPQFDAIHDLLTAEEHLYFYGRIRGVAEANLERVIETLCQRLTLDQDGQHRRPSETYSGGNKRKLSVAISLIGNPPVVFLDEPSTGMDPVSRRFMWDFLSQTMAQRAVILTTHSMEECEALCSRIGIQVMGRLRCLGSAQHLKNKYGRGFQVDVSVFNESMVPQVRGFFQHHFQNVQEIECFGGAMKFRIDPNMSLADVFSVIETNKKNLGIVQYGVGQTSLDQIFIQFARQGDHEELAKQVEQQNIQVVPHS